VRGEIWLANLDPAVGVEANKVNRPVVLVGVNGVILNTLANNRGVLTVVPLTSNVERVRSFQVYLPAESTGLSVDSKAQCEQIRSIDVSRLHRAVGRVPSPLMDEVDDALRLHLGL